MTGYAIQTARRARPTLHRYAGDALVCGSRAAWVEVDGLNALIDAAVRNGHVCPTCIA